MDKFKERSYSPMLMYETRPFNSDDYIYEIKFDGIRSFIYIDKDGKIEVRNKRNIDMTDIYPELQSIAKSVKDECVLDGELVCFVEGKPDFYKMRKRSLMSDKFKIEIASKTAPITFVAFDVLYLNGRDLCSLQLLKRKELLSKTVKSSERIIVPDYIVGKGNELFALTVQTRIEGIIAKRIDSEYYSGKRTDVWQKIKVVPHSNYHFAP